MPARFSPVNGLQGFASSLSPGGEKEDPDFEKTLMLCLPAVLISDTLVLFIGMQ